MTNGHAVVSDESFPELIFRFGIFVALLRIRKSVEQCFYLGHSTLEKQILWRLFYFSLPLPTGKIWALKIGKKWKMCLTCSEKTIRFSTVLFDKSSSPIDILRLRLAHLLSPRDNADWSTDERTDLDWPQWFLLSSSDVKSWIESVLTELV